MEGGNVSTFVNPMRPPVLICEEVGSVIGAFPGVNNANVYGVRLPNHDGRAGCVGLSFRTDVPSIRWRHISNPSFKNTLCHFSSG